MMFFAFTMVLGVLFPSTASIKCYTGFRRWSDTIEGDLLIKLEECEQDETCCRRVDSLPGSTYSCATDCPESESYPVCDKRIDSGSCYCKDHEDENCAPSTSNITEQSRVARDDSGANNLNEDTVKSGTKSESLPDSDGLRCYVGFESSQSAPFDKETNTTTALETCSKEHACCHSVHSLPGSTYACSSDCPKDWSNTCGPHPKEGLMDIGWCYCKDYKDEKCIPVQFKSGGSAPTGKQ